MAEMVVCHKCRRMDFPWNMPSCEGGDGCGMRRPPKSERPRVVTLPPGSLILSPEQVEQIKATMKDAENLRDKVKTNALRTYYSGWIDSARFSLSILDADWKAER